MNKEIITFFTSVFIFVLAIGCSRENPEPIVERDSSIKRDDRSARSGPGYSWEFTTPNQSNPVEYQELPEGRRYYLKQSAGYLRSITLKVTKTSASSVNPSFRIYGRQNQCLGLSSPTSSSGSFISVTFQQTPWPGSLTYSGYEWTPSLSASAVGATATFTFTATPSSSACIEGFIGADMSSPVSILSAGSYWDGDYMYLVKKAGI